MVEVHNIDGEKTTNKLQLRLAFESSIWNIKDNEFANGLFETIFVINFQSNFMKRLIQ